MRSVEISVVSPVFNEEESLRIFIPELLRTLETVCSNYEVIFAVDPCTDSTIDVIEKFRLVDSRIKYIEFSRKFGQPAATIAGIECAVGRAVIVMDCDMQDPPSLIPTFVSKWREGFQVVYAQRSRREGETAFKKFSTKVGYFFINKFAEVDIPRNTGDFRLLDRLVVDHLRAFPESHSFLRGLVALIGFNQSVVVFDRPERSGGSGKYNRYFGNLRFQFNGLVAFSTVLLNISTVLGFITAFTSVVLAVIYTTLKLIGTSFPLGNPTIVILLLFLGGAQLTCLGIIGQYIGRIYDDVKRRPRYIIKRRVGFEIET
jgi:glycosyltransferase involved in cell wall biosynthesis